MAGDDDTTIIPEIDYKNLDKATAAAEIAAAADYQNSTFLYSFKKVCPTANQFPSDLKLEAVSIYQTIDLLCEGEIAGLCDSNGQTIRLTSNSDKNEDGFKGIYLNDIPVKNTRANTLNYNRVFADFRVGGSKQRALTKFENPSLSFTNAVQTLNIGTALPGLNEQNSLVNSARHGVFMVDVPAADTTGNLQSDTNEINLAKSYIAYSSAMKGNFAYQVKNISAIEQLRKAEAAQVVAVSHRVTNDNCTDVQIDMMVNSLSYHHSDGDISPGAVNFAIKFGYVDDELTTGEGGSIKYIFCGIYGKCSSGYTRSHNVVLPAATKNKKDRFIKIFRTDNELPINNVKMRKDLSVAHVSEIVQQSLTYPHSALMGMIFDGRGFSQPPTRRFDCKLTKVLVPSNYNPDTKEYTGNWDGQFASAKKWTDNPAWIFYDLATNSRYGIGKYGFRDHFVDKWNLYSVGKYCDELVPTGYSGKFADVDFTIDPGGVIVSIDDSSTQLGEEKLKNQFPEGSIVCLFETNNSSGADLDTAYKRVVIDTTYSSSTFKFKIVKIPTTEEVFLKYPVIKQQFIKSQNNKLQSGQDYLINRLIDSQNATTQYIVDYLVGEPLNIDAVSGIAAVQFEGFLPLLEARFSCNIYFDRRQNAYNALNDIAALFRGMIYWSSGYMFLSNDQAREAVMLFTNANVQDGVFVYSGSAETSRSTAVTVRYNDETDSYKPKVEYLEDEASLREFGYKEKEVIGLGITSRGQAHRLAKWMLYTNQTETDTIQFTTGQEGSYLRPGDVVKVQDKLRTSKRYGGRLKDIDHAARTLTLDEGIQENIVGQKITVLTPKANTPVRELNETADSRLRIAFDEGTPNQGMSTAELDSSRQTQIKQFTIASVSETNVITISETTDEDFNLVEKGYIWSVQNTASTYKIEEIEYRLLAITEQSSNAYQVTGMLYNRSKFKAIDESKSIENTQQSKSQMVDIGSLPSPLSASGTAPTSNFVVVDPQTDKLPPFDAKFPSEVRGEAANNPMIKRNKETILDFDFTTVAAANAVTKDNTGGYVVEVNKGDGEKVRFTLQGHDNTKATILMGDEFIQRGDVSIQIYRLDPSLKMESTGLPQP